MYESGSGNELELLLSAESFSDLVNKAEYIKNVHTYDREKQEEYIATTKKIEKLSESLQEEAESMTQMQSQLEEDKTSLGTMIEGKQSEIAQLDADIQEAVAAQQAAEEARRQQEAAAAAAAAQDTAPSQPSNGGSGGGSSSGGSGSGGGSSTVVPPQGRDGWAVVAYARQFLGNPYEYGGNSLTNGIDCSGFTQQIYAAFGVSLGRTDTAQASAGVEIPLSQAQAGDLVVYYGHVGIYNGSGGLIHALVAVGWDHRVLRQLHVSSDTLREESSLILGEQTEGLRFVAQALFSPFIRRSSGHACSPYIAFCVFIQYNGGVF